MQQQQHVCYQQSKNVLTNKKPNIEQHTCKHQCIAARNGNTTKTTNIRKPIKQTHKQKQATQNH